MKKENILEIIEKAIIIGLSLNVAYLLFAVVFKAVTEVICNLINPYSICVILAAILVWQSYLIAKQGVPGDEERKASDLRAIREINAKKIKKSEL